MGINQLQDLLLQGSIREYLLTILNLIDMYYLQACSLR